MTTRKSASSCSRTSAYETCDCLSLCWAGLPMCAQTRHFIHHKLTSPPHRDNKDFQGRVARQGGVGGAQMKVSVRNLRIREVSMSCVMHVSSFLPLSGRCLSSSLLNSSNHHTTNRTWPSICGTWTPTRRTTTQRRAQCARTRSLAPTPTRWPTPAITSCGAWWWFGLAG